MADDRPLIGQTNNTTFHVPSIYNIIIYSLIYSLHIFGEKEEFIQEK